MRAGRLVHTVVVEQLGAGSPQQFPTGEPDVSWGTYCTVRASIDPSIGREFFAAAQVQSDVDTKIGMRYESGVNSGLTSTMRVRHPTTCPCGAAAEQIYEIEAVINVGMRNRELVLMCSMVDA